MCNQNSFILSQFQAMHCEVCSSALAVVTKRHTPSGLNNTFIFSRFGGRSSRLRCWQGWFLESAFFLACRGLLTCYVLMWPFLCAPEERQGELWCSFLLLKGHQSYQIRVPPLWPHFSVIPFLNALSPIIVTLGVRISTQEFCEVYISVHNSHLVNGSSSGNLILFSCAS